VLISAKGEVRARSFAPLSTPTGDPMRHVRLSFHLMPSISCVVGLALTGCVAFNPAVQSKVEELNERPYVAILPFGFDLEITTLSDVKTVEGTLSTKDEAKQLAEGLREIRQEARWLFLSRLATGQGFRFVPLEQTDALAEELLLKPGALPNADQLMEFRRRLGADLVVAGSILDYGKVRWQWSAAGAFADLSAETIIIGLASEWNPAIILANVGVELLTNSAIFFGGGYLFGIALRPVRVEARAFETVQGYPIWQSMDASAYAWGSLKMLPEEVRGKKEAQLELNLAEIMESLGDRLTKEDYVASRLRGQPALPQQ
jgi:hypothetical protein